MSTLCEPGKAQEGDQTMYHHCFKLMALSMHSQRSTKVCVIRSESWMTPRVHCQILTLRDTEGAWPGEHNDNKITHSDQK